MRKSQLLFKARQNILMVRKYGLLKSTVGGVGVRGAIRGILSGMASLHCVAYFPKCVTSVFLT